LRVLIGCEESGVVRRAFRGRGHDATSVDLLPARDNPDYGHIQGDIMAALALEWDLVILHPPCQYIAVSGNKWHAGTDARKQAIDWTIKLWEQAKLCAPMVALENPVGLKIPGVKPQWVQPWQFGHPETKKTGLWLHGLPPLVPTDNKKAVVDLLPDNVKMRLHYLPPSPDRAKIRSTTYLGIADAMAAQWGNL
jgi:hypothetical protein